MVKPLIQLALDTQNIAKASEYSKLFADKVGILEVGTILAFAEGVKPVTMLDKTYPDHLVVCDMKITDGGEILARMAFSAGADWVTVSAGAHIKTIAVCKKVANEFAASTNPKADVQIELYGRWDLDDAKQWAELGVKEVVYHRSRDAELAGIGWTKQDIELIRALGDLGFNVSVTGGITAESIQLFKGLKVRAFIVGRLLTHTKTPEIAEANALALHQEIDKYFG